MRPSVPWGASEMPPRVVCSVGDDEIIDIKDMTKAAYICTDCGPEAPCIILGSELIEPDGMNCGPSFKEVPFEEVVAALVKRAEGGR